MTYGKVHFQQFYKLRYRTKLGEVRNKYADENALNKSIASCMFKAPSKQP